MRLYASQKVLIIGITRYEDPQYDLTYARPDAEAMAKVLQEEFGFDTIWTLYDDQATRDNIRNVFERDLQRTDEDDGIVIFFAGHGITFPAAIGDDRGFLVPHDGKPRDPRDRYANLSMNTIRDDYLPNIPAKHVFLIVDACYGGLALRDIGPSGSPGLDGATGLEVLTRRDHKIRQVLAAGTRDQKVLDGGLFGHSVFTGRLIEALREANPHTTADHIGVQVRERVIQDALDRNRHRQTPQFGLLYGQGGTFVFVRGKSKSAISLAPQRPSTQRVTGTACEEGGLNLKLLEQEPVEHLRQRVRRYKQLLKMQPSLGGAHAVLGKCYYLLGDTDAAAKHLVRSLERVMDAQTRTEIENLLWQVRARAKHDQEDAD